MPYCAVYNLQARAALNFALTQIAAYPTTGLRGLNEASAWGAKTQVARQKHRAVRAAEVSTGVEWEAPIEVARTGWSDS